MGRQEVLCVILRYTAGRTEYISQDFLGFSKGTKVFEVYDWFAEEFKRKYWR